ncbi:MAG: ACT domain-containing protein [Bacteroidales bacterium]
MKLIVLDDTYKVCRMDNGSTIPEPPNHCEFFSITVAGSEISLVLPDSIEPLQGARIEPGWKVIKLDGPFEFTVIGIISRITGILAASRIPVFVISTFDTDYVLVKQELLITALKVLSENGYEVVNTEGVT